MNYIIGAIGQAEVVVDSSNMAKTMGSGSLEVFATPAMIALMEKAATEAIKESIPEDSSTVGTLINIKHLSATPVGMKVTARATLTEIDGKRLVFSLEAFDGKDKIGEGLHERFVINIDKFMGRTNGKL